MALRLSTWSRFIARLAALVPPPKRHLTRYFGVLSSHAAARSAVVPAPAEPASAPAEQDKPASTSKYIPWAGLSAFAVCKLTAGVVLAAD